LVINNDASQARIPFTAGFETVGAPLAAPAGALAPDLIEKMALPAEINLHTILHPILRLSNKPVMTGL